MLIAGYHDDVCPLDYLERFGKDSKRINSKLK